MELEFGMGVISYLSILCNVGGICGEGKCREEGRFTRDILVISCDSIVKVFNDNNTLAPQNIIKYIPVCPCMTQAVAEIFLLSCDTISGKLGTLDW